MMILGSFVLFAFAWLLLLVFPPAAFVTWLVSVVLFFVGMSHRRDRKIERRLDKRARREAP